MQCYIIIFCLHKIQCKRYCKSLYLFRLSSWEIDFYPSKARINYVDIKQEQNIKLWAFPRGFCYSRYYHQVLNKSRFGTLFGTCIGNNLEVFLSVSCRNCRKCRKYTLDWEKPFSSLTVNKRVSLFNVTILNIIEKFI